MPNSEASSMDSSMPNLMNKAELSKAFFQAPQQWLAQHSLSALSVDVNPHLLAREQALQEKGSYKVKTGKLSREIGALKKAGQPAESLIAEMKGYKSSLKDVEATIAEAEAAITALLAPQLQPKPSNNTPKPEQQLAQRDIDYSALQVELLTAALKPACEQYLQQSPRATLYHQPGWCGLIEQSFSHKPHYYVAHMGGEVVGVLPLIHLKSRLFGAFAVSMPYFNYGGPIGETEQVCEALVAAASQQAANSKLSHIEYRCLQPLAKHPGHQDKISMWLGLPSASEQLWQALGAKVRAQVNKAKPHGFTVHIGGAELLDDFYQVFAINMRDLGTPVYAKSFFQNILASHIGKANIVLLKNSLGQPVSASFLLGHKQQLEVPWASTLKKENRTNANMLLYWSMLQFACEQGYKVFDFGRSSVDASTYKFKKQWGAKPVQLHWHYWLAEGGALPQLNPNNPKYKMVIWAWQRLPVWLTKILGPHIVKSLP